MDALEFCKVVQEICAMHHACVECEFSKLQGMCNINGKDADHSAMAEIAEKWRKEHPVRTRKDALLGIFPTVEEDDGVPVLCPKEMDEDWDRCGIGGQTCEDCRHEYWLAEADENDDER